MLLHHPEHFGVERGISGALAAEEDLRTSAGMFQGRVKQLLDSCPALRAHACAGTNCDWSHARAEVQSRLMVRTLRLRTAATSSCSSPAKKIISTIRAWRGAAA